MPKVRIELAPDFGPRRGQTLASVLVEPTYGALLSAAQNKLQLKNKETNNLTLYSVDFTGRQLLGEGDLTGILHNGAKVVVSQGESTAEEAAGLWAEVKISKTSQKAVNQLQLVKVGSSALSARGRPSLETLVALQRCKTVTGVVTLLRHDECMCAAASIGQACARLGLKWWHAPLSGPREMSMIGHQKASLTSQDLESFKQVQQLKPLLEAGEENLVVHCAAGLHRTGIFLYVLLRNLGAEPEEALDKIRQMRQETFDEFSRLKFRAKADAIFAIVGSGARGTMVDTSLVEVVTTRACTEEAEEEGDDGDEDVDA